MTSQGRTDCGENFGQPPVKLVDDPFLVEDRKNDGKLRAIAIAGRPDAPKRRRVSR